MVPLLKPGKRADELRSYRPVSLTSLLCRITERMLLLRIAPVVERFLDAAQVGSRRGGNANGSHRFGRRRVRDDYGGQQESTHRGLTQ